MAKSRAPAPDPPAESEESREEEATSEETEESEAESEPEESKQPDNSQAAKKPPSTPAPAVKKLETLKPPSPDTSSDEEGSGSDSESDSPETIPDPTIKPIASKPMETTAANKSTPKAKRAILSSTSSATGTKRQATSETVGDGDGDGAGKETKRLKKKPEKYAEESEKKGSSNDDSRKLFQRLWSDDDVIAVLNGMSDFSVKKKADPVTNIDGFHEFIKKSLHIDVSRRQLKEKIRSLRKKYANNAEKEMGKDRIFAKDYDQKVFELSKKLWGKENSTDGKMLESPKFNGEMVKKSQIKNANTKKPLIEANEEGGGKEEENALITEKTCMEERLKHVNLGLRNLGMEEWIMENRHFVDEDKRAKMDENLKNFKVLEAEFNVKKLELLLQESKLILDALKSSTG